MKTISIKDCIPEDLHHLTNEALGVNTQVGVCGETIDGKAEKILLNYTASREWEEMIGMEWTTTEVHGLLSDVLSGKLS